MDCEKIRDCMAEYIGQALDDGTKQEVDRHLSHCEACFNEIRQIDRTTWNIESDSRNIKTPADFLKGIEEKVIDDIKPCIRIPVWFLKVSLAAAFTALLVTAFILFVPQNFKYRVYSTATFGRVYSTEYGTFGRKFNISSTSNSLKVTAVKVSADDMATVIYFKAGTAADQYTVDTSSVNIQEKLQTAGDNTVQGENPIIRDESYSGGFAMYLRPITKSRQTLDISFSKINRIDDSSIITGTWSFKIPVEKIESITYNINNNLELDGYTISFKKLTICPTGTYLSYGISSSDPEKVFIGFYDWDIVNGKRICKLLNPVGGTENGETDRFESVYPEKPGELAIDVKSLMEYLNHNGEEIKIPISLEGTFPKEFNYNGNTIKIDNFINDKGRIQFDIIEPESKRNYTYLDDFISDSNYNVIDFNTEIKKCLVIDENNAEYDYEDVLKDPAKYQDKCLQFYPVVTHVSFNMKDTSDKYFNINIRGSFSIQQINRIITVR